MKRQNLGKSDCRPPSCRDNTLDIRGSGEFTNALHHTGRYVHASLIENRNRGFTCVGLHKLRKLSLMRRADYKHTIKPRRREFFGESRNGTFAEYNTVAPGRVDKIKPFRSRCLELQLTHLPFAVRDSGRSRSSTCRTAHSSAHQWELWRRCA